MPATTPTLSPLAVKDAIDAHSGRFEFFKQTLTLGSAALAGIAALFTDPARVPTGCVPKAAIVATGVALFTIVGFAVMGLSTYASLLTALAREADLISATKPSHKPSSYFSPSIAGHAQVIIVALFVAWISLTLFAGYQLFAPAVATSAEMALTSTRTLVSRETGQPTRSIQLDYLKVDERYFLIRYSIAPDGRGYILRVARDTNDIRDISREEPRTRANGDQAAEIDPEIRAFFDRIACYEALAKRQLTEMPAVGWLDIQLSKDQWTQIQSKLVENGLLPRLPAVNGVPKSVDGIVGNHTRHAIRNWHRQHHVRPASKYLSEQEARTLLDLPVNGAQSATADLAKCDQIKATTGGKVVP